MYKFFSGIVQARRSATENTKRVTESRIQWDKDRQEREDLNEFILSTALGAALAAKDPSIKEIPRHSFGTTSHSRVVHDSAEGVGDNGDRLNSDCEAILLDYCLSFLTRASPKQDDTGIKAVEPRPLEPPFLRCEVKAGEEVNFPRLPSRLIQILMLRWHFKAEKALSLSDSHATATLSRSPPFPGSSVPRPRFLRYLETVLACWNALLETKQGVPVALLLEHGIEECTFFTLRYLSITLMSRQEHIHPDKKPELEGRSAAMVATPVERERVLSLIRLLIRILYTLHVGHPPPWCCGVIDGMLTNDAAVDHTGRITDLSNEQLISGCADLFLSGTTPLFGASSSTISHLSSSSGWQPLSHSPASRTIASELISLLTCFLRGSLSFESEGEARKGETDHDSVCAIFIILCTTAPASGAVLSSTESAEVERIVNMGIASLSMLLTIFARMNAELAEAGKPFFDFASHTARALLHQLTCGMLFTTRWLRQCPVPVAYALRDAGCLDNLLDVLAALGRYYPAATFAQDMVSGGAEPPLPGVDHPARTGAAAFQGEHCNVKALYAARLEELECKLNLLARPRVEFAPVAANAAADEFLYSYLGLLAAQRVVRWSLPVLGDPSAQNALDQLRVQLLRIFFVAESPACDSSLVCDRADRGLLHLITDAEPEEGAGGCAEGGEDDAGVTQWTEDTATRGGVALCIHYLLVQHMLDSLPEYRQLDAPLSPAELHDGKEHGTGPQEVGGARCPDHRFATLTDFHLLVDAGLYRICFADKRFFTPFRYTPQLCYAVLYALLHVLTLPEAGRGGSYRLACEVEAITSAFLSWGDSSRPGCVRGRNGGVEAWSATVHEEEAEYLSSMCAVLLRALRGPNATLVRAVALEDVVFALMACVAVRLSHSAASDRCPMASPGDGEAHGGLEGQRACAFQCLKRWAQQVMLELASGEQAVAAILSKDLDAVFSLLTFADLRETGEKILVALLCLQPSDTKATRCGVPMNGGHAARIRPLIQLLWSTVHQCVGFDGMLSAVDPDALLLSLLGCLRRSLHHLRRGAPELSLRAARALQSALCDMEVSGECFLTLIHRASQPWEDPMRCVKGLQALLATLTSLIAGYPALRHLLFSTVTPGELVSCFHTEWLATQPDQWKDFVEAFLDFAYELCAEDHPVTHGAGTASALSRTPRRGSVQNAGILIPLLGCFKRNEGEVSAHQMEGLAFVLDTLHATFLHCHASLILCAQVGLFDTLAQFLLPLMDTAARTTTTTTAPLAASALLLLHKVAALMKLSASQHVDIKHVKHLLMMVIHRADVRQRERLVPWVANILSGAVTACLEQRAVGPLSYIAFRRNSGLTGLRATIHDFPLDGYTLCFQVRVESDGFNAGCDGSPWQTIFSLCSVDHRTILQLSVSPATGSLTFTYLDPYKHVVHASLGCQLPLSAWVHLSLTQRPLHFLLSGIGLKPTVLLLNGEAVLGLPPVPYPAIVRGFLLIGTDGVEFEELSCAHSLVGQVTSVYFFPRPLLAKEIQQLCPGNLCHKEDGLAAAGGAGAATLAQLLDPCGFPFQPPPKESSASAAMQPFSLMPTATEGAMVGPRCAASGPKTNGDCGISGGDDAGSLDVEKNFAARAMICIDPRLSEKGQLRNLASLLRGDQRNGSIETFEGTMICYTTSIVDALCVLGALYTVILPLWVLLLCPRLPFTARSLLRENAPSQQRCGKGGDALRPSPERSPARAGGDETVQDLLQLLHSLACINVVRADMTESGLLLLVADVLERLGPTLGVTVPERLLLLCTTRLLPSDDLFEAAYRVFFLSSDLLHASPPETQLVWISCQRIAVSVDADVCARVRALDAQLFLAAEIAHTLLESAEAPTARDLVEEVSDLPLPTLSPHWQRLYEQLFLFLEALTVDPITMDDALPILYLTTRLLQAHQQLSGCMLAMVLRRLRLLLFSRNPLLCQFLGRKEYAAVLLRLLSYPTVPDSARREALLQLVLLTSRSKRTQELMNPVLLTAKDVVHVARDVSLVWLKDYLQPYPADVALYMTFRCALVGAFGIVDELPIAYSPLASTDALVFVPTLAPMLLVFQRCRDSLLKIRVLSDLVFLLKSDPRAWQQVITVPGWYALVVDLYQSERAEEEGSAILSSCTFILAFILFQALLHVNYAASEQALVVAYLQAHGLRLLLNCVLCGVADRLRAKLVANAEANQSACLGFCSNAALSNVVAFVHTVEEVLFYATSCTPAPFPAPFLSSPLAAGGGATASGLPPRSNRASYSEWDELLISPDGAEGPPPSPLVPTLSVVTSPQDGALAPVEAVAVRHMGAVDLSRGKDKHGFLLSPDGRWVHMDLAIKVATLLTTNVALLNSGRTPLGTGPLDSAGARSTPKYRKGGFLRIFARLFRVGCAMTLRSASRVQALLFLVECYTRYVEGESAGLFSLMRSSAVDDCKEHSPLAITMSFLYSIHDLLLRRRRAAVEGDDGAPSLNAQIVDCFKRLFLLFKKSFEQMPVFAYPTSFAGTVAGTHPRQVSTFHWLCDRSASPAATSMEAFVEMAFRTDYKIFMERCALMLERDRIDDKVIATDLVVAYQRVAAQLCEILLKLRAARQVVLDSLQSFVEQFSTATVTGPDATQDTSAIISTSNSASVLAATRAAASAARPHVMTHFLEYIEGTIWNVTAVKDYNTELRYVSLSLVEQQLLVRRKIISNGDGRSYREVCEANRCHSRLALTPAGVSDSEPPRNSSRLRLRGGEEVLLDPPNFECEEGCPEVLKDSGVEPTCSLVDEDSRRAERTPRNMSPFLSTAAAPVSEETEDERGFALDASTGSVVLSIACEVPYMMHCWSATFFIHDAEVCVILDKENMAYNQQVASEAQAFLIRPKSFRFSVTTIKEIAPGRRFRMKRCGLEIWLCNRRSCFVVFCDPATMRLVMRKILQVAAAKQRLLRLPRPPAARPFYVFQENPLREPLLLYCLHQWHSREMSNFDYLIHLNRLAGRSLNDMTQYPIFPWVVADYTSEVLDLSNPKSFRDLRRPMGACGSEERCALIKERYEDMKSLGDVPSHYFTHYSSPAVVLYYLVRLEPFTSLHILLQGGHFDHPDRMFHTLASTFRCVTTSSQDVRELIPELYYLPELCINHNNVCFGWKQDSQAMSNLVLPPWAHDSPYEFVYRMREALECDYVSSKLHHWIDLIFGVKQRGKEAIEALNVFNWHAYEDLDRHRGSAVDQKLLVDSLDNIGQTPIQLFHQAHCERLPCELQHPLECDVCVKTRTLHWAASQRVALLSLKVPGKVVVVTGSGAVLSLKMSVSPLIKRMALPLVSSSTPLIQQVGFEGKSACEGGTLSAAAVVNDAGVSPPPLPSPPCQHKSHGPETGLFSRTRLHAGGCQNASFDIDSEYERCVAALPPGAIPTNLHDADGPCTPENSVLLCLNGESFVALGGLFDHSVVIRSLSHAMSDLYLKAHRGRVVRLAVSADSCYLVTGSEDTTFVVWSCHLDLGRRQLEVDLLFTMYGHEDVPTAAYVCSVLDVVASASMGGVLMLHSLSSGGLEHTLRHPQMHPIHHILIQSLCYVPNILFSSNIDHIIHQITLNGTLLRSITPPGRLVCWTTTSEQFLLMCCAPLNRAAASASFHMEAAATDGELAIKTTAVHYLHSFFLVVLKTATLQTDTAVTCIACHPKNSQVVVVGTAKANILLICSCAG